MQMPNTENKNASPSMGMPMQEVSKVNWTKIIRWGLKVVSYSKFIFILSVILLTMSSLLAIYQPLILGRIISELQIFQQTETNAKSENIIAKSDDVKNQKITAQNQENKDAALKNGSTKNSFSIISDYLYPKDLNRLAWLFFIVVILNIICAFYARYITSKADSKILHKLQLALHDKILTLGSSYHRENDIGRTSSVVNQLSSGAQMMFSEFYRNTGVQIVTLISSVLVLVTQLSNSNVPDYLIICLIVIIIVFPIIGWKLSNLVMTGSTELRNSMLETQSEYVNSATNPLEIQLMNANKQRSNAFNNKLGKYCSAKIKFSFFGTLTSQYSSSATPFIQALFIVMLLVYTPHDASNIAKIAAAIIILIMLIPIALSPVQQIIAFFTGINSMWPTVKTVIDVLEMEPEIKESANAVELSGKTNEVKMTNLTFGYTQHGKKIFTNISHVFPAGKITAITAHYGTGKSTAFNLLMRLFDPQEGSISIGGQDIKGVSLVSLRTKVVRISQMPLFVHDTVRENFKLSKNDATDKEIEEASKKTGFWDDVLMKKAQMMGVSNPLDIKMTLNEWSGGQKKIFALTRALLVKPTVILIDEPVAGVDAQNSKLIATIIKNIFKGITVLIVDHNQEFIKDVSDFVVCLEDGKFSDVGTPEELVQRPSLFKTLLESFKEGKEV